MEKEIVVGNGFFKQLLTQKHFVGIEHHVDPILEGLKWIESGERCAHQDNHRMPSQWHHELLHRLEAFVGLQGAARETVFDDHHLVGDLIVAVEELAVVLSGVNLVAELRQRPLHWVLNGIRGDPQQGRTITGGNEIELVSHGYILSLKVPEGPEAAFDNRSASALAIRRSFDL